MMKTVIALMKINKTGKKTLCKYNLLWFTLNHRSLLT